jgi:plastocyanin
MRPLADRGRLRGSPAARLVLLALVSSGVAGTEAPAAPAAAAPAAPGIVIARDFMFAPMTISIKAGSTVTWKNTDDEPHTVVSDTGLFRSGALDTNESFSFRFDKPGTYHYACSIHPRMVGTIVVE